MVSITQPATAPGAANYGLGTCADASMTADLSSSYTGPTIAMPAAGTAGTATTGGTQSPKYTFTHDNEGRMTAKGTQANVYDALNRMTQVTNKESYLYDGHGRRVQVTKTADGKINYPLYSLDGKLLQEDNRQTLQRIEYIHVGGRLVAKKIQPITSTGANNGTATVTTIHTDFLGSPVAETNSAGTVTRIERYTPYGEPADMQLDVGPGFTGHATDVATGLTYMQQRYYDADIGRFISPDPVGPEEDFINHFNRYNYAQNNPVRYTDPDGRIVLQAGAIAAGAFWGGLSTIAHDVATGKMSSTGTYLGNISGGAVAGGVLATTGNPVLAGALGGAVSSSLQQYKDSGEIKVAEVAVAVRDGAILGTIAPSVKISGATKGANSWSAVAKTGQKNYDAGKKISIKTYAKSAGAAVVESTAGAALETVNAVANTEDKKPIIPNQRKDDRLKP